MTGSIDEANAVGQRIESKDLDRQKAIALVNLYTQETPFYSSLNTHLRSGNLSQLWKDAGDLLNRAVDILGKSVVSPVYHGKSYFDRAVQVDDVFSFNQLSSTSKSPYISAQFADCGGYMFEISNVDGLDVRMYSAIPDEDEIVLKYTAMYKV